MKRTGLGVFVIVAAFFVRAEAQPWVRTYPLKINEPTAVCALSDGGSIYASSLDTETGSQVLVFKVDARGLGVWAKAFDAPLSSKAIGCRQLKNGNILVWGDRVPTFDGSKENSNDAFLLILNGEGEIVTEWEYGVPAWNLAYVPMQVVEMAAGGYLVCGELTHLNKSGTWYHDYQKGWIARLNAEGKVLWQKAFALKSSDAYKYVSLTGIAEASDGGILCAGWFYSTPSWSVSMTGLVVLKLNAAGRIVWQKVYEAQDYSNSNDFLEEAMGLFAAKDGGGLLVGMDWVEDYPWVVRLNKGGTQVWGRVFEAAGSPGDVEYRAASMTRDQGCLIGGGVYPDSGSRLGWFAKVGSNGTLKVTRSYVLGGHYYNNFLGMAERLAGGFIFVGRSYDSYYSREIWAMTTSTNGLTSPTVKPASFKPVMRTFKLFPYKAGFKIGAGGAAFGPGAFTVVDVSTESKEWAAPTTPPGESSRILKGKPGVGRAECQAIPRTLKEMLKAGDRKK